MKVPVARCFNVLHNKLYEEETEQPLLAAGMLGSQRTWFAPQASLEPLGETTLQRLAARPTPWAGCASSFPMREATGGPAAAARTPEARFSHLWQGFRRPCGYPSASRRYDVRCLELDIRPPEDGWLLVTDRWAPVGGRG